jgi:glycosyltransferase involved in cell wall biosynthesis
VKVVLLSYDFGEYCIRLASAMANDAAVSLVLARDQAEHHVRKLAPAVDFRPFDKPRLRQAPRQVVSTLQLVRTIRRLDPDVIHFQRGHLWFNLGLPLLKQYPLVMTVHDPRHHLGDHESRKTPQAIMDFGYRQADQLVVHGSELKRVLIEECGIAAERIHVMPHIVLGECDAPDRAAEEPHTILFFGRIWEYKGLEYLIRAEPLIAAAVPDVRIVIAGEGDDFAHYRRMMVHPERFEVHNEYVSNGRRAELFRRASMVVLPYVEASQSGVIPLAYTFGKPVVATTVGGLPEAVDHGQSGLLVPPRDERALAEAVVRLLQDQDSRRRMGEAGRRKIQSEASGETVAEQTLAVYRRAIGHPETSKAARGPRQGEGFSTGEFNGSSSYRIG